MTNYAPYKIARFAIENVSLGYIQKIFVKAFWSTKTALRHVQKINDKFNRSKKVELVRVGRNEAVVRLHWDHTMGVSKDLCLYNQGTYTFLAPDLGKHRSQAGRKYAAHSRERSIVNIT